MFFLLRCIFWLSLVFWNLPEGAAPARESAGAFFDTARGQLESIVGKTPAKFASAASNSMTMLATASAEQGAEWCRANGEACIDAVLLAMSTKVVSPSQHIAPAAPATSSIAAPVKAWRVKRGTHVLAAAG